MGGDGCKWGRAPQTGSFPSTSALPGTGAPWPTPWPIPTALQGPSWSPSSQPLTDPLGTEGPLPPHSFLPQQTWPPSLGGGAHTPRPGRGAGEIKQYTVLPRKSDSASEDHPCPAGSDLESTARAQASETRSAQGPAGPPSTQPQNAPDTACSTLGPVPRRVPTGTARHTLDSSAFCVLPMMALTSVPDLLQSTVCRTHKDIPRPRPSRVGAWVREAQGTPRRGAVCTALLHAHTVTPLNALTPCTHRTLQIFMTRETATRCPHAPETLDAHLPRLADSMARPA